MPKTFRELVPCAAWTHPQRTVGARHHAQRGLARGGCLWAPGNNSPNPRCDLDPGRKIGDRFDGWASDPAAFTRPWNQPFSGVQKQGDLTPRGGGQMPEVEGHRRSRPKRGVRPPPSDGGSPSFVVTAEGWRWIPSFVVVAGVIDRGQCDLPSGAPTGTIARSCRRGQGIGRWCPCERHKRPSVPARRDAWG